MNVRQRQCKKMHIPLPPPLHQFRLYWFRSDWSPDRVPGTLCGKVLRFVLRADMETGVSLVASAEVDLTMKSAPSLGELKVSTVTCIILIGLVL